MKSYLNAIKSIKFMLEVVFSRCESENRFLLVTIEEIGE